MSGTIVTGGIFLLLTVFSAMVVLARNPVTSAISLVGALFVVAATFAQLGADFVAAIQVIVYAGAIVVLFVFVIMLLNLRPETMDTRALAPMSLGERWVLALTIPALGLLAWSLGREVQEPTQIITRDVVEAMGGNTAAVGQRLFTAFVWPFEMASILILLAIVGSVLIARGDKVEHDEVREKGVT